MQANRRLSRFAVAAVLLGAALTLGAGPLVPPAEAHRRHKAVKVHPQHRHATPVYRDCDPRPRVGYRHVEPVQCYQPWYVEAPRMYVASSPYYFHAGLNVYLGGVNLNVQFSDPAPYGYVYMDPYCDLEFRTVEHYHRHLSRHPHDAALQVMFVGD